MHCNPMESIRVTSLRWVVWPGTRSPWWRRKPRNCQSVIYRNGAADFEVTATAAAAIDYAAYGAVIVTGTALAREPSRGATL